MLIIYIIRMSPTYFPAASPSLHLSIASLSLLDCLSSSACHRSASTPTSTLITSYIHVTQAAKGTRKLKGRNKQPARPARNSFTTFAASQPRYLEPLAACPSIDTTDIFQQSLKNTAEWTPLLPSTPGSRASKTTTRPSSRTS